MKTRLGQNFLTDKNIAAKIAGACGPKPGITVIEIGPGKGILTEELLKRYDNVLAVELDRKLYGDLLEKFAGNRNIEIVNADFLKWDIPEPKNKYHFTANIPYYITSPIIEKVLNCGCWDTAAFMVQKEVAERIEAKEKSRKWGVLGISCRTLCDAEILFDVPGRCFQPAPKVTSSVIRLKRLAQPLVRDADRKFFIDTVKAAFTHRRKTIANSLSMALGLDKNETNTVLLKSGIEPKERPEKISISQFYELSKYLKLLPNKK